MAESLKNIYTSAYIKKLANSIQSEYPKFDSVAFIKAVFNESWDSFELKQRMHHISYCLHQHLPVIYTKQIKILLNVCSQFKGYAALFFPDFVEQYGQDDFKNSIAALEIFTEHSSSEFAVRPFLIRYEKDMLQQHLLWVKHPNEHVRRLASEGVRPRLPWAAALPAFKSNPKTILPIYIQLLNDPSVYVRKSVANGLNDISKDHPELIHELLIKNKKTSAPTYALLKHACRTLLKKGDTKVLDYFGIKHQSEIKVLQFTLDKKRITLGEYVCFNAEIIHQESSTQRLRLAYNIYYKKANGELAPKLFHIGEYEVKPKQSIKVTRKKQMIDYTTRKHYKGQHKVGLVVNGKELTTVDFELH